MTDDLATPESDPLEQRLHEASRLGEEGRWDEAFALLLDAERDFPDEPTVLCMLGVVAGEMDARGAAYDFFRRSLIAQPQDPHVLVALGTGLARYDDPDAEGVLRLAAISAPGLAATRLHYGAYLAREGIFDLALAELQAARDLDPEDPQIERELGSTLLLAGSPEQALARLEQAVALAPDDAELRLLLGLALLSARRLEEGAEEVHRAAVELPEDGDVQILAALAAATQEWMDEAWNALARAEGAPLPPDSELLRDVEDALESGADPAATLLLEQVAPPLLRERLLERP